MDGWVKINRNIINWSLFKDGNALKVWLYLIACANYEDSQMPDGRIIKAGQVVFSYRGISRACGISEREARTAIKKLVATHSMTHEATHQYSVATLENWAKYQSSVWKTTQETTHKVTTSNKYKEINSRPKETFVWGGGLRKHD